MRQGNGIRALLWDADGVLQHDAQDWRARLDEAGGPGFAQAVFDAELPALRGERTLRATLTDLIGRWPGPTPTVEELLHLWETTTVDPEAMALVGEIRVRGILTVLATNQQDHRVGWMRDRIGYEGHFDRTYWSALMGVMKPDPAFFEQILADLALPADQVGFVDDSAANVAAAQRIGIRAVRHDPASGAAVLRREVESLTR